ERVEVEAEGTGGGEKPSSKRGAQDERDDRRGAQAARQGDTRAADRGGRAGPASRDGGGAAARPGDGTTAPRAGWAGGPDPDRGAVSAGRRAARGRPAGSGTTPRPP